MGILRLTKAKGITSKLYTGKEAYAFFAKMDRLNCAERMADDRNPDSPAQLVLFHRDNHPRMNEAGVYYAPTQGDKAELLHLRSHGRLAYKAASTVFAAVMRQVGYSLLISQQS